ncbi:hypothetical protein M3667_01825 [Microbacterium sp. P26]|uniref:hypothetical protein n=1 Tax=Microbacterium TaxID=33882 RepID=UPI00203A5346|nr:hypothetical protein [Microbacterium sp. P26]MCM3500616.1 hypothetical protein [Microbacterium sp. P26]
MDDDNTIRTGSDDIFAWETEQMEPEAEALAYSIRTDVARAVREYEGLLVGYRSVGYAAMVSARAVNIATMEILATPEMPVEVATIVAERISTFVVESKKSLEWLLRP